MIINWLFKASFDGENSARNSNVSLATNLYISRACTLHSYFLTIFRAILIASGI